MRQVYYCGHCMKEHDSELDALKCCYDKKVKVGNPDHPEVKVCPDCGVKVERVIISRYMTRQYRVDYEKRELVPIEDTVWEHDEDVVRCYECVTLNMAEYFESFTIKENNNANGN